MSTVTSESPYILQTYAYDPSFRPSLLEFGSELGEVTAHLCQIIGATSGVPSDDDHNENSRARGEAWLVDKKRSVPKSGRMPSRTVESFVSGKNVHFLELAVIVKSRALAGLSRRLIHAHRLFDGTTVLPPPRNDNDITTSTATKSRSSQPYWIAGVKVDDYRKTIPFVVQPGDAILEVGSHFGRTTKLLDDTGR